MIALYMELVYPLSTTENTINEHINHCTYNESAQKEN